MDVLDIARFWSKVVVRSPNECWPWREKLDESGYGQFKMDGKPYISSRVAFTLAFGEPPEGSVVRHDCDNRACCNPKHLLTGTHADNVRDRVIRQRGARGEKAGRAKLTEADVLQIRQLYDAPIKSLAERFSVSKDTIEAIRYRRSWTHLP